MDAATTPAATALRYRVAGMDCPSCASKIETALNRLGGTDGVRLNYQTQVLTLEQGPFSTPNHITPQYWELPWAVSWHGHVHLAHPLLLCRPGSP